MLHNKHHCINFILPQIQSHSQITRHKLTFGNSTDRAHDCVQFFRQQHRSSSWLCAVLSATAQIELVNVCSSFGLEARIGRNNQATPKCLSLTLGTLSLNPRLLPSIDDYDYFMLIPFIWSVSSLVCLQAKDDHTTNCHFTLYKLPTFCTENYLWNAYNVQIISNARANPGLLF